MFISSDIGCRRARQQLLGVKRVRIRVRGREHQDQGPIIPMLDRARVQCGELHC